MDMSAKERSQEWSRIARNTVVSKKVRVAPGFKRTPRENSELISAHIDAFIAKGGKIDVLKCELDVNPKAQTCHHMGLVYS